MGKKRDATPEELARLIPVRTPEAARALSTKRWEVVRKPVFKGEWAELYNQQLAELIEAYGQRGPQYRMLCDLSAGLFVQIKRMEATGAIRGLEQLEKIIARLMEAGDTHQDDDETLEEAIARAAQSELYKASEAVKLYLRAIEQVRKLIDQAQRYTEARKAEVVVTEVNLALVSALHIVEAHVDPRTFANIVRDIRARIEA